MNRIQADITVFIDNIPGDVETLRKAESAVVSDWKEQGILEHLYIRDAHSGAILVFKDIERSKVEALISTLPLQPYFDKVDYTVMEKSF